MQDKHVVKHDGPSAKGSGALGKLAESMAKFANGPTLSAAVKQADPARHTHTHSHTERIERYPVPGPTNTVSRVERHHEKADKQLPAGLTDDKESVNRVLAGPSKGPEPLPAAGRLMEVVKAQQNVEKGLSQPSSELAKVANLVREGGHKEAAGIPPERIREIIQKSTNTIQIPGQANDPDVRLIGQKFEGPLNLAHQSVRPKREVDVLGTPITSSAREGKADDKEVAQRLLRMVDSNETTHVSRAGQVEKDDDENGPKVIGLGGVLTPTVPSGTITSGAALEEKIQKDQKWFRDGGFYFHNEDNAYGKPWGIATDERGFDYERANGLFDVGRARKTIKGGLVGSKEAEAVEQSKTFVDRPKEPQASQAPRPVAPTTSIAATRPIHPHKSVSSPVSGRAKEVMRGASGGQQNRLAGGTKRLEGTLKLVGAGGQALGEAIISATEA